MQNHHNREVSIEKSKLIEKIKENRDAHVIDYNEAVIAYRKKAESELKNLSKELKNGSMKLNLHLITPINRSEEYDKIIEMFNWEINDIVKLTQKEFNEYVLDETTSAQQAKFSNSAYKF